MASFFHARQAGDLALGKPALGRFLKSSNVGEALRALKKGNDLDLSLWEELCPLTEKPIKAPSPHGGVAGEVVIDIPQKPQAESHGHDSEHLKVRVFQGYLSSSLSFCTIRVIF
jgi:hypothetical protein